MNEYDELLEKKGLSLERLATLCRVVDQNGLSRAAKGDVSQLSQYSKQIKDLESFFGVALTRKVGTTAVLTEAAQKLASQVRGHFKDLLSFGVDAGKMPLTLTIGASHSLFEWWMTPRLKRINSRLPAGTRLRWAVMRSADLAQALENRQVDVAFIRSDAVPRTMRTKALLDVRYVLFVPKALVKPGESPAKLLERVPLALSQGGQFRDKFDARVKTLGLRMNIALDCPSFTLAAQAARTGQYAAMLPDFAQESLKNDPLVAMDLGWKELMERKMVVAWHPRAPEAGVKSLIATISSTDGRYGSGIARREGGLSHAKVESTDTFLRGMIHM
jgi:DNA-binding transcriptional LysR family regulator